MIYLGLADSEKADIIRDYIAGNAVRRLANLWQKLARQGAEVCRYE